MGAHKLITPPTEFPVMLSDLVKVHIKVDDTDEEAGLLEEYIRAATERVQDEIQRQLMQATFEYHMDDFSEVDCDGYITLKKAPLVSVESVKYYDENNELQTMSADDYQVDTTRCPGRIRFIGDIPSVYDIVNAVQIQYVAGYGSADDSPDEQRTAISNYGASRAKVGILRAVADFYEHRQDESPTQMYQLNEGIRAWLHPLKLYL
jgi:uncharacterized phiE125 gp8 family phage protein